MRETSELSLDEDLNRLALTGPPKIEVEEEVNVEKRMTRR